MQESVSRRVIVKTGLFAALGLPVLGLMVQHAQAASPTPFDPSDPLAKSLNFVTDASKVNC
jgi:hypothetical protein